MTYIVFKDFQLEFYHVTEFLETAENRQSDPNRNPKITENIRVSVC